MATSKIQTGLRLDEVTLLKIKYLAEKEKRSLNNLVEYVLACHIEQYESENGIIPFDLGSL